MQIIRRGRVIFITLWVSAVGGLIAQSAEATGMRYHVAPIYGELDPGWFNRGDPGQGISCNPPPGSTGPCSGNDRTRGLGVAFGVSRPFALWRLLKLSAHPFLEAGVIRGEIAGQGQATTYGVWGGMELWHWILGSRLMVGMGGSAAWYRGAFQQSMGGGFSWCVSCSSRTTSGWDLDRVTLRRTGTFSDGKAGVERFELQFSFRKLGEKRN